MNRLSDFLRLLFNRGLLLYTCMSAAISDSLLLPRLRRLYFLFNFYTETGIILLDTRTSCTQMGVPSSSCAANRRRRPSKPRRALSLACPSPSSRRPRLQCARSQSLTQRSSSNTCISRSWRKTWPLPHSSRTL